jgi:exonuclease V
MPTGEPDELDDIDFSEFTSEDWAIVDQYQEQVLRDSPPPPARSPGPPLATFPILEYMSPSRLPFTSRPFLPGLLAPQMYPSRTIRSASSPFSRDQHSPRIDLFAEFRRAGHLSVSDLVGPSWCEVKFDYTLRWGQKWQRVAAKPDTLVTANGKKIEVSKTQAIKGEATMDAGRVSFPTEGGRSSDRVDMCPTASPQET